MRWNLFAIGKQPNIVDMVHVESGTWQERRIHRDVKIACDRKASKMQERSEPNRMTDVNRRQSVVKCL